MGILGPWPGARTAAAPIVMQITLRTLQNATFYPRVGGAGREMRYVRITRLYVGTLGPVLIQAIRRLNENRPYSSSW
jgi:hypothetical protein